MKNRSRKSIQLFVYDIEGEKSLHSTIEIGQTVILNSFECQRLEAKMSDSGGDNDEILIDG